MKLKNITLVFENCDSITIDGKYVGEFIVDDIHTSIERIACNAIERIDSADTFAIEIHKDANKERYQFNQTDYEDFKQMTFDRLSAYNDTTSIQINLIEDYVEEGQVPREEHYDYYVKWTGESDYANDSQVNYMSNCGNFYIVIAEGKNIEDFFDSDELHKKMCDMSEEEFVKLAGEEAWWRSSKGSILGHPYTKFKVNDSDLVAWDSPIYESKKGHKYEDLSDYLCNCVGVSTEKNVCACATDLAKYNDMTMGELFAKYEG